MIYRTTRKGILMLKLIHNLAIPSILAILLQITGCTTIAIPAVSHVPSYTLDNVQIIWNQSQYTITMYQNNFAFTPEEMGNVHVESLEYLKTIKPLIEEDLTNELAKHGVKTGGDVSLIITPVKLEYSCRDGLVNPFTYKGPKCQNRLANGAYFDVALQSKRQTNPQIMWTVRIHCWQSTLASHNSVPETLTSQIIEQLKSSAWISK